MSLPIADCRFSLQKARCYLDHQLAIGNRQLLVSEVSFDNLGIILDFFRQP